MPNVDERVVKMQFDNARFESGVKESVKSLEKLKKGLELNDSAESLTKLQKASDNFSLDGIAKAVDKISDRFSTLGIIGMRILENIADKAVSAGERMVKSLSIDQISTGFSKYEQKTKAVQTIVNATGASMDEVDRNLSKLSWYTDETSYSFTDMVSNIGKFTSMNIPLEDSVTAMEGISNWAAASGQGIGEASRAMYNLSQAMGTGAVKLMDWKSIENANMATAEFKNNVIKTAKALGKLDKNGRIGGMEVTSENFSATLAKGWFTKDVLLEVLKQYGEFTDEVYELYQQGMTTADAIDKASGSTSEFSEKAFRAAQEAKTFTDAIEAVKEAVASGWMTTFELIFGNYEEAKVLWTDLANDLYDIFAAGAEARNDLLEQWKTFGGRDDLLAGLYGSMQAIKGIIEGVKRAFHSIFPPTTVEQIQSMSSAIKKFGDHLEKTYGIITTYKEFKRKKIIDINPLGDLKEVLKKGSKGEEVRELQKRLNDLGANLQVDGIFGPKTEAALNEFKEKYGLAIDGIYDEATHKKLGKVLEPDAKGNIAHEYETVREEVENIPPALQRLQSIMSGVFAVVGIGVQVFRFLAGSVSAVFDAFSPLKDTFVQTADALARLFVVINDRIASSGVLTSWLETFKSDLAPVKEEIDRLSQVFLKFLGIEGDLDKVDFEAAVDKISEKIEPLLTILRTLYTIVKGVIQIGYTVGKFIFQVGQRIYKVLSPVFKMFGKVFQAGVKLFEAFGKRFGLFADSVGKSTKFQEWLDKIDEKLPMVIEKVEEFCQNLLDFIGLGGDLDEIDFDKIIDNIINSFKSFFGLNIDASNVADGIDAPSVIESIKQKIMTIYTSVRDWIVGLFTGDKEAAKAGELNFDGYNLAIAAITGIIGIISANLISMVITITKAGKNINGILKNIKGFTSGFKKTSTVKAVDSVANSIIKFAGAIAILAGSVYLLSTISWADLGKGLLGIAAIMGIVIGSLVIMQKTVGSKKKGFDNISSVMKALDMLALAILGLSISILMLSKLNWSELARGLGGMTALMAIAIASLHFLGKLQLNVKDVSGTIGLLGTLAAVLGSFANVVKNLGIIDISTLAKGIAGLGSIMAMVAVFMKAISKLKIEWTAVAGMIAAGVAIGLVVGSFLAMAFAMKFLNVTDILKAIGGMLIVIGSIALLMKAAEKITPNTKAVLSLIPIAIALDLAVAGFLAVAFAMKMLSVTDVLKAVGGMLIIIGSIALMMKAAEKINPSVKSIISLLPIAIALDLVVAGFIAMAVSMKFVSWREIGKAVLGMGVVILSIAALCKLMQYAKPSIGSIIALLPFALALDLAIAGFVVLALSMRKLSWDDLLKAITAMGSVVGMLAILTGVAGITKPGILTSISLLISVGALVAAMIAFSLVLKQVKSIKTKTITAFASGLMKILLAFAALSLVAGLIGPAGVLSAALAVVAIGAAIGLLVGAFLSILNIPGVGEFLSNGAEKFGEIIGSFIGAMKAAELKAFNKGMESFGEVNEPDVNGINNLLECARLLSDFTKDLPTNYTVGKLLTLFKNAKPLTTFANDIIGFANGFNTFSNEMQKIENVGDLTDKSTSVINIAKSLAALVSEDLTLNYTGGWLTSFFSSSSPLTNFGFDIAGFAAYFNSYATIMSPIKSVGDLTSQTQSVVNIAKSLAGLVSEDLTVNYTGGWLTSLFSSTSPLTNFGFDIAGFASYFNSYASIMTPIKSVGELTTQTKSVVNVAKSLSSLVSEDLSINYTGGWITSLFNASSPLTNFGFDIAGFATYFNSYASMISPIKNVGDLSSKTNSVINIAKSLSSLVAENLTINYTGGWLTSLFSSSSPLTNFGFDIAGFATYFNSYATVISPIKDVGDLSSQTQSVVSVAKSLSSLVSEDLTINYTGGWLTSLFNSSSPLTNFGSDIVGFSKYFNSYASLMSPIKGVGDLTSQTQAVVNVAKSFAGLVEEDLTINYTGGWLSKLFSNDSPLTTFGEDIVGFAPYFDNFGAFVSKLTPEQIDQSKIDFVKNTASAFSALATSLPPVYTSPTIKTWFSKSDTPLSAFGEDLGWFAEKFDLFTTAIGSITYSDSIAEKVDQGISIANSVATFLDGLTQLNIDKNVSGLRALFTDESSQQTVFNSIADLAASLFSASVNLNEFSTSGASTDVSAAIETAKKFAEFLEYIGDDEVSQKIKNSDSIYATLDAKLNGNKTGSLSKLIRDFSNSLKDLDNLDVVSASVQSIVDLMSLISSGQIVDDAAAGSTISSLVSIVRNTATKIKDYKSKFEQAGSDFVQGLANGVTNNTDVLVTSMEELAQRALDAMKNAWGEASPSKKAMVIGEYFSEGLAIGVKDEGNALNQATQEVAKSALSTASGTLASLSSLLTEDIDDNPMIRPIVDLSNVRSSASMIGGMFGPQSVPVYTRGLANAALTSGTRSSVESVTVNGNDSAAVSKAISALNDKMGSLENAITNMKVVTETGALIGQIASGMDKRLGEFARLHERGG